MIPELNEKQILDQATQKINSAMNFCTKQILTSFENSFNSLNALHKKRESEKDQIILDQKDTITNLRKFTDVFEAFSSFSQQYSKAIKPSQINHSNLVTNSALPFKVSDLIEQKPQPIESKNSGRIPSKQNEKIQVESGNRSRQKKSREKVMGKVNPEKVQIPKKRNYIRRNRSIDQGQKVDRKRKQFRKNQKDHSRSRKKLVQKSKDKSKEKSKEKSAQKPEYKSPLQCRASHPLNQVAYTPSFTKLKFIQYEHKIATVFEEEEVKLLEKYDLKDVSGFALSSREVSNKVLTLFTKLDLVNLRSLRIEGNKITDLRPLGNLNLKILEDLDVSCNPLSIESAYFLAMENFESMVYLTVSFDTGLDDECWRILLGNEMENYPKIQALDVCNQNQLNASTKKSIQNCMLLKAVNQKRKASKQGFPNYPERYQVKISWNQSEDIFTTYPRQKQLEIGGKWQTNVHYESIRLPRLPARQLRRAFDTKDPVKKIKRKGIRKAQRPRCSLQSRMKKVQQHSEQNESKKDQNEQIHSEHHSESGSESGSESESESESENN